MTQKRNYELNSLTIRTTHGSDSPSPGTGGDEANSLQEVPPSLSSDTDGQPSSRQLALSIAQAADERKAADIALLRVEAVSYLSDYFVVATGFSKTQVRAIADSITEKAATEHQLQPLRVEGKADGSWVLMDYGDVIVHIFLPQEREYYCLEAFWGHAERLEFHSSSLEQEP